MPGDENHLASFVTTTELLERLKTSSHPTAWRMYDQRFRPVIVGYARRAGVPAADADDVAQQTLAAFYTALRDGKYLREKGRLRSWLFGIAQRQVRDWRRRRGAEFSRRAVGGESELAEAADTDDALADMWEQEWRDALVRCCLDEIRREVQPATFEAFRLLVREEWEPARVAAHLGISANAVYGSKRRVLARLRELMPQMEEGW